jgi:hypothetical protein
MKYSRVNKQELEIAVHLLLSLMLLLFLTSDLHGQTQTYPTRVLRNADVIGMVQDGVKAGVIISRIFTSPCNFDIFPPVLRDLKRRGVPDTVLAAMKAAPNGPPAIRSDEIKQLPSPPVRIPEGTVVEVESSRAVSSANALVGSQISFAVTKRVFVDKVLVIERGSLARARVVKSRRAKMLGRAGMLAWEMDYVVAVDGSRIPVRLSGELKGKNRAAVMAGGAAATGALFFPYTSPVALIWGLKKGDEAVLRGSRVFLADVTKESEVAGLQPRPGGVIYRDRETVKASTAPPTNTNFERGSFGPKGPFRPQ